MNISNLLGMDAIAKSNRQLGDDIIYSNRELSRTLKDISDAEIKSKNRVDITLEEYENMKDENRSLSYEVARLRNILERIEVPLDKEIVLDSIRTYWSDDIWDFKGKRKFRIEFEIDHWNLRHKEG